MDQLARLKAALADRYAVDREVGSGGMATVYLAEDLKHHRQVALKVLRPDLAASLGADRFLREIEIAARLQHPHVLPLYDSGEADGFLYYVMPFVKGESLRDKLAKTGELPIAAAVRILRDVVDALAHAHREGVVHRDIKPDNVLLSDNHAVVTDFGVAKAVSEATGRQGITTAGVALGTPSYMAPEQAAAEPNIDHRADIYAVGAMAFEILSGAPPFAGLSAQAVLSAHITQTPEMITARRPTVPAPLAEIVMRCLEKKPADRWQSAEEVLARLEVIATPSGGTQPVAPVRSPRHRVPLAVGLSVVAVLAVLAAVFLRSGSAAPEIDPNVVAVMPFRISGADPQVSYLREGLVDLFHARLGGEGGPRALVPQTVISAWRRAGGSETDDLDESRALSVAAALGAGQLLLGSIVGSPNALTLSVSLIDVGGERAPTQVDVSGPVDSLAALVDHVTAELLALRAGETSRRLSDLTTRSLPALRAYLEGQALYRVGRYVDATQQFERALDEDSTFALAGLAHNQASAWYTSAPRGLRLAWRYRDRLNGRDRTLLDAIARLRNYPVPASRRDVLDAMEQVVAHAPDGPAEWYRLGDVLFHFGNLIGEERAFERAATALERAIALDSGFAGPTQHLVELAARRGDVEAARRYAAMYFASDSVGGVADHVRWRLAVAENDTAALAALHARFTDLSPVVLSFIWNISMADGVDVRTGERAVQILLDRASTSVDRLAGLLLRSITALNGGRPREAASLDNALLDAGARPNGISRGHIMDAMFWDGDSTTAAAAVLGVQARALTLMGASEIPNTDAILDVCVSELWRLAIGEGSTTASAIQWLRRGIEAGDSATVASHDALMCASLLNAVLADLEDRPDAREALEQVDSLSREGLTIAVDLLVHRFVTARLWERRGEPARALAALRRRCYFCGPGGSAFLSSSLREEGRIAAMTGDTLGAIEAYRHYLALRPNPEPELQEQKDRITQALAALLGER